MKTAFILILLSIGLGYFVARSELNVRNAEVSNLIGGSEDILADVKKIPKDETFQVRRVEVVDGPELKFGAMRSGETKHHTFVLKNTGEAPVDVWFMSSTCKCTVGKLDRTTLQPGGTTEVEMTWDAKGVGTFSQSATIGTSIPYQEEIQLTISGHIAEVLMLEPKTLDMGDFLTNDTHELQVKILNYGDIPLGLEAVAIADDRLAAKAQVTIAPPRPPEEGEYEGVDKVKEITEVKIFIDKGLPSANFDTHLDFRAPSTEEKLEIPTLKLSGRSVTPIRVIGGNNFDESRRVFKLGIASSSEGIKQSFLFGVKTAEFPDAKMTLARVAPETATDVVKVTVGEPNVTKTQKLFPVSIEVPAGTSPIEFSGASGKEFVKLVFNTGIEDAPEESVYLQFQIHD